jgi:hypothetical protein
LTKPAKTGKEDTMMMVKRLAGVALGALLAVNAFAFFGETEPNNTRATPDVLVFDAADLHRSVVGCRRAESDRQRLRLFQNLAEYGRLADRHHLPHSDELYQPDTVMALFDGTSTTAIVYND